jgi:hypothetical protein
MDNRIETVTDSFGRTVTYKQDADGKESLLTKGGTFLYVHGTGPVV